MNRETKNNSTNVKGETKGPYDLAFHVWRFTFHAGIDMLNLNHKNLDVWKMSLSFVSLIYKMTNTFPKSEMYGMTSQLRRAAISIPSNIAEGASRDSSKDRKRFFEIARSSLVEVDSQLEIAKTLNYLNVQENKNMIQIEEMMNRIFAMLSRLKEKTA